MRPRGLVHIGFAATAAVAAASVAWTPAGGRASGAFDATADCQFAIRASNNLSFDVWVDLYDSQVSKPGGFGVFSGGWEQLKIQNHRIRSRGTMDRRYTAPGKCEANRTWWIKVRRGSAQKTLEIGTGGTSSTSRTVDLGPSSQWTPID